MASAAECLVPLSSFETWMPSSWSSLAASLVIAYALYQLAVSWQVAYQAKLWWELLFMKIPTITVELTAKEAALQEEDSAAAPNEKTPLLTDPQKPGWIHCHDPSTLEYLGQVENMTAATVHKLCVSAKAAQVDWAKTSFAQRRQVLRTLQKYLVQHMEEICRVSCRDSGKPMVDAVLGEILTTCEKIRCMCDQGELWLRPDSRPTGPLMMHKHAWVEYVPLGVIAPIAPWNYPFHNSMNHIISGLFAGNAVVGKVSEHTSWSAAYFGRMVKAALVANGHSPDLVQTVTGMAEAGSALVSDPCVDKIIFTGSPGIGKLVMKTASEHLKPVLLELGGKDAMIITDDNKGSLLKAILPWVMRGCFQNCGQNCVGIERVLVYESVHDDFVEAILPKVQGLLQGIPCSAKNSDANVDVAAMVTETQIKHIQTLVDEAVTQGAKILCGGKRNSTLKGQFYQPTVLAGVTPACRIFHEEVFGPVLSIIQVPKDSDEACLALVNTSDFGLGSSVYCGNNTSRGLRLARRIRSGMVCVNDFGSNYLVQALPFGGVGDSGFGRFGGPEGLRACCLERSMLTDALPGIKTTIPGPIDYPIDKTRGFGFSTSLVKLFYDESLAGKLAAIFGLIKHG